MFVVRFGAITGPILPVRERPDRGEFRRCEMANLIRMRGPRRYHVTRDGVPSALQAGAAIDKP